MRPVRHGSHMSVTQFYRECHRGMSLNLRLFITHLSYGIEHVCLCMHTALPEFANSPCAAGTRRSLLGTRRRLRQRWPTGAMGMAKAVFAVCQSSGTRQKYSSCVNIGTRQKKASRCRHGQLTASAVVRRVPAPWTHGEDPDFAVCPDSRHTTKLEASPCAGTADTRPSARLRRVPHLGHTAKYGHFAVC